MDAQDAQVLSAQLMALSDACTKLSSATAEVVCMDRIGDPHLANELLGESLQAMLVARMLIARIAQAQMSVDPIAPEQVDVLAADATSATLDLLAASRAIQEAAF